MQRSAFLAAGIVFYTTLAAFGLSGRNARGADIAPTSSRSHAVAPHYLQLRDGGTGPYQSGAAGANRDEDQRCRRAEAARIVVDAVWVSDVIDRVATSLVRREGDPALAACDSDPHQ